MKILRKFFAQPLVCTALATGLSVLPISKTQSCVFTDYKNVYIFGINLLGNSALSNYYYNSPYAEDVCFPGNEKNIEEWQKLYPSVTDLQAFHEIVYKLDLKQLNFLYEALSTKKNPFPNNPFAKALIEKNDSEVLQYLLFAKACEPLVSQQYGWEAEENADKNTNSQKAQTLLQEGLEKLKNTSNAFIKQRLAFQIIRLAYYQVSPNDCIKYFDELADKNTKNYIYYRSLLHKAFALKKLKDKVGANQLFAEVFANEPSLSCLAFKNMALFETNRYSNFDETAWQATLKNTSDEKLRAALFLLRSASYSQIDASLLENSLALGASEEQLQVMLLRQLKAAESNTFLPYLQQKVALDSAKLTYGDWNATDAVVEEKGFFRRIWDAIINFFKSLFGGNKGTLNRATKPQVLYAQVTPNPIIDIENDYALKELEKVSLKIGEKHKSSLFYLGAAYLQIMRKAYGLVDDNLALARQHAKDNEGLLQQAAYLEALKMVLQAETITEELENKLAAVLPTLWKNKQLDNNAWQRLLLCSELGRKYLAQGDLTKAVLTFQYTKQADVAGMLMDFYMTQGDLDNLANYIKGEPSGAWKKLLVGSLGMSEAYRLDFIKDVQATKLCREGKFVEAAAKYKSIAANYWKGDPVKAHNPNDTTKQADKVILWNSGASLMLGISENSLGGSSMVYSFADECPNVQTTFQQSPLENPQFEQLTKVQVVEKLAELVQKAQSSSGDEQAQVYISMANGMLYSPFWLYNAAIWQCGGLLGAFRDGVPNGYPFNVHTAFATNFHNRKMHVVSTYCVPTLAAQYYAKAATVAKDKELIAKALYSQGFALKTSLASHWEEGIKLDAQSPLQRLMQETGNTKTAQEAISLCPELSMYR
jgi:hypothetical protein